MIHLELALANRLLAHLHNALSDDWVVDIQGLDPVMATNDLIELALLVLEAEQQEGQ